MTMQINLEHYTLSTLDKIINEKAEELYKVKGDLTENTLEAQTTTKLAQQKV